jgi:hypothetical protein
MAETARCAVRTPQRGVPTTTNGSIFQQWFVKGTILKNFSNHLRLRGFRLILLKVSPFYLVEGSRGQLYEGIR